MAKVITLSQKYPPYHPKAGQPTMFAEKVLHSLFMQDKHDYSILYDLYEGEVINQVTDYQPKHHTIRAGRRWKTGDMASLRVWGNDINPKSGKSGPYHSKQIVIAPDVPVRVWDFEIKNEFEGDGWYNHLYLNGVLLMDDSLVVEPVKNSMCTLAQNDGLELEDLLQWFKADWDQKCNMVGQIICWNLSINY